MARIDTTPRTPPRPPVPLVRGLVRMMGRFIFREDLPFEKQRARLAVVSRAGKLPPGVTAASRRLGGVVADEVRHESTDDDVTVLHLHGGGYVTGEPTGWRTWSVPMAIASRATIVLPDYRLAPEHPFPAALDDAAAAWKELTSSVDPSRVVLSGDSAGGGLAVALAAQLRDEGSTLPAGLLLISPWLDLTANRRADHDLARRDPMLNAGWLERSADAYGASTPLADAGISPLLGSLAGLPPALVQAGADDLLIADSIRFARAVIDAGGEATLSIGNDLWHDFPLQAGMLATADGAVRQAAAFVDRVTREGSDDEAPIRTGSPTDPSL
jgi:acetyl esterase/lipase